MAGTYQLEPDTFRETVPLTFLDPYARKLDVTIVPYLHCSVVDLKLCSHLDPDPASHVHLDPDPHTASEPNSIQTSLNPDST